MTTILGTESDVGFKVKIESKNPLFFNQTTYFTISGISLLLILTMFVLGEREIILARILFITFSPFLVFLIFISFTIGVGYHTFEKNVNFRKLVSFIAVASMASTMMAVALNTRGTYLVIFAYLSFAKESALNPESSELAFLVYAVMAPIIEETLKALPLLIVMRGHVISWGGEERRVISNYQTAMLFAILSGGIFTMLETYSYILGTSDFFIISIPRAWRYAYLQVFVRSTSPLHYFTTSIVAIGIFLTLYFTPSKTLLFRDYTYVWIGYFIAVVVHGIWNGLAVSASSSTKLVFDFLPIQNFIMGILLLITLILIVIFGSRLNESVCPVCNNVHSPPYESLAHYLGRSYAPIPSLQSFFWKRKWRCKVCKTSRKEGALTCEVCGTASIFTCGHCGRPIPVYSVSCWSCGYTLNPPYSKVFEYRDSLMDKFSVGFTMVFAGIYIVTAANQFILYFLTSTGVNANQTLLFFVMGLSYIITVKWALSPNDSPMGILLSRLLTGLTLIQIVFLFQILAIFLSLLNPGFLIFPTLINVLMIIFALQIIFKYEPVLKGGNLL